MPPTRSLLVLFCALAGLLSALLIIFTVYPVGRTSILFLHGAAFGLFLAAALLILRSLPSLGKGIALIFDFTVAYYLSVQAAFAIELYTPFGRPDHEHGSISNLTLFVGGFIGAFLVLSAITLLFKTQHTWQRRILAALCWAPLGGLLGILGWHLATPVGALIMNVAHSLRIDRATETPQTSLDQTARLYSLWAVWQTGIGILIGLLIPLGGALSSPDKSNNQPAPN
jgi:hypothetical protein